MNARFLTSMLAVSTFALAACGPDTTATVNQGGMELESEFDTTSDALLSNSAGVWFPMQEGNTWTLESASGSQKVVSYSDVADAMGWLDGLQASGAWMGTSTDAPNTLYRWDENTGAWGVYFRFGYAVTQWSVGAGACGTFNAKRTATGITAVTPAGTFASARSIGFTLVPSPTARCIMPPWNEITFAPDVGPVAIKDGNGEKWLLKSANVNGTLYPRSTGSAKGTLKADKLSYVNQSNTIRCITTPCPSNQVNAVAKLSFTVTNTGTTSATWQFASGKQYDIDVVNSVGKVVRHWSDGKMFTMALSSFTLAAGASKTFSTELSLTDTDLNQLDGSYTLKAYLVPRLTAPTAAASTGIKVTVN